MKPRNPYVVPARKRKAGVIKSRRNRLRKREFDREIRDYLQLLEEDYIDDTERAY